MIFHANCNFVGIFTVMLLKVIIEVCFMKKYSIKKWLIPSERHPERNLLRHLKKFYFEKPLIGGICENYLNSVAIE